MTSTKKVFISGRYADMGPSDTSSHAVQLSEKKAASASRMYIHTTKAGATAQSFGVTNRRLQGSVAKITKSGNQDPGSRTD